MNNCLDCEKRISPSAFRCKPCSNRFRAGKYITKRGYNLGANNRMWKGDNVSYRSLHEYLVFHNNKPALCVKCQKKPPYDLANISGLYKRDINDYQWLCRRCHMISDGRLSNLVEHNRLRRCSN